MTKKTKVTFLSSAKAIKLFSVRVADMRAEGGSILSAGQTSANTGWIVFAKGREVSYASMCRFGRKWIQTGPSDWTREGVRSPFRRALAIAQGAAPLPKKIGWELEDCLGMFGVEVSL
jgi:hypothetical protein